MSDENQIEEQREGSNAYCLLWVVSLIANLTLHFWTVGIAYSKSGLLAAIISLFLPGVATIFWFIKYGLYVGIFSSYCVAVLIVLALNIIASYPIWVSYWGIFNDENYDVEGKKSQ